MILHLQKKVSTNSGENKHSAHWPVNKCCPTTIQGKNTQIKENIWFQRVHNRIFQPLKYSLTLNIV